MDREGEHPVELGQHGRAVFSVELQQHLGVAGGPEAAPVRSTQLIPQRLEVVDLAVEHDAQLAGLVEHRLIRVVAQVDDAEPGMGEARIAVHRPWPAGQVRDMRCADHPLQVGVSSLALEAS